MTRVASLYYIEEATQAEIASLLGLSRPKVGRLLQRARHEGVVQISVRAHPGLNAGLESEVAARFGLAAAILVADQDSEESQRALTARAVAELLARSLHDGSVVAVGMGRNVGAVPQQLSAPPARSCTFVSAMGGSPQVGTGLNPNDICRRLAEAFNGAAESLYAPAYAESKAARAAFMGHVDVRETLARARAAECAVVGIGDARNDSAVVQMGCFSAGEMAALREAGAVGDILGSFFDAGGRAVRGAIGQRVVGLSADDLRSVPRVVAMAGEPGKARSVLGALRSGMVDVLVTSVATAEHVLAGEATAAGA
jgi:DNA-binding transcriptional regulator LsrR (DeoR family)